MFTCAICGLSIVYDVHVETWFHFDDVDSLWAGLDHTVLYIHPISGHAVVPADLNA
jgi:hypothetical protein